SQQWIERAESAAEPIEEKLRELTQRQERSAGEALALIATERESLQELEQLLRSRIAEARGELEAAIRRSADELEQQAREAAAPIEASLRAIIAHQEEAVKQAEAVLATEREAIDALEAQFTERLAEGRQRAECSLESTVEE